jgi:hypothetical protein
MYFFTAQKPKSAVGRITVEVSRSYTIRHTHTHTHTHIPKDSPERVISLSHRPLPTQHTTTQETNIRAVSGIRTHDSNNQAVSDLRLRSHGHRNRPSNRITQRKSRRYPLKGRLGGPERRSGRFGEQENLLTLPETTTISMQQLGEVRGGSSHPKHCRTGM